MARYHPLILSVVAAGLAACDSSDGGRPGGHQPQTESAAASKENRRLGDSRPNTEELDLDGRLPNETVSYLDRKDRVRIELPADWYVARRNLTPRVAEPVGSLAAGTSPLRPDPNAACPGAPDQPQIEVGPRDALFHVRIEPDEGPAGAGKRPSHFRLLKQVRPADPDRPASGVVFPWSCLNRVGVVGVWT